MLNKATAGTGAGTFGGAIVILLVWFFNLTPPDYVIVAMQTVVSGILTFLAVWYTPHKSNGVPP